MKKSTEKATEEAVNPKHELLHKRYGKIDPIKQRTLLEKSCGLLLHPDMEGYDFNAYKTKAWR